MIKDYKYVAVFPLAIPSIASPGAIMAVVLLNDNNNYTLPQQAFTTLLVLLVVFYEPYFAGSRKSSKIYWRVRHHHNQQNYGFDFGFLSHAKHPLGLERVFYELSINILTPYFPYLRPITSRKKAFP